MTPIIEKRKFDQGINADDSYTKLEPGEYFNGFNLRGFTSEDGHISGLQPIHSTKVLFNALPAGQNYCIGACAEEARHRIVFANWNAAGSAILTIDTQTEEVRYVLFDAQVPGGLNFDKNHLIHSSFILNGTWYFTDGLNEPRRINIDAGLQANVTPTSLASDFIPDTRNLPVSNADPTGGAFSPTLTPYTFELPTNPMPTYASGYLTATIIFTLASGPHAGDNTIVITPGGAWNNLNTKSPGHIIADGIVSVLISRGTGGIDWQIYATEYSVTLYVRSGWDWGLGTATPTTAVNLKLNTFLLADGTVPNPYQTPISQSVIAWVRRQPAIPPFVFKNFDPLRVVNNVKAEGFFFSFRYVYREYEISTLSGQSSLVNYNSDSEPYNFISVSLPLQEQIDQDVIRIDLVAEYVSSGVSFIIKTWDLTKNSDANAIGAHNRGTALSYAFYNDMIGQTLDTAYSVKQFDNVPLTSQTTERAKNRSFLGGNVLGYDTPKKSSLTIATQTGSTITPPTPSGEWFIIKTLSGTPPSSGTYTMLYISNFDGYLGGTGYYQATGVGGGFPASVPYTSLTFLGADPYTAALTLTGASSVLITDFSDQGHAATITGLPAPSVSAGQLVFKSGTTYQAAIEFMDKAGRKCGVYTDESLKITTQDRDVNTIPYVSLLKWTLNNSNALAEIPVWAYSYSVLLTKSLRTRFFLQGKGANAAYAAKGSDGNYTFTGSAYIPTAAGCAFDISNIFAFQMGYTFNEGDVIKIYQPSGLFGTLALAELSIIAVQGNWVITELKNINNILDNTTNYLFEIYTPYKKSTNEPFYETGQIFLVASPGTNSRKYSYTSGTLKGDIYVMNRGISPANYFTESMSPTDKFWKIWNTNSGRPNFVEAIGQVNKTQSVSFSNPFIQGSQTNGLSTYDALDSLDLSAEFGDLQKLVLTSKIQKEGTVMLALCRAETVSLYLGETQVAAPQGNAFLSVSANVIGTVYPLRGSRGCGDPESVQQWNGDVFWFNRYKGEVDQYSDNGIEAISKFKTRTFWRNFASKYSSMSKADIEALGSRPFIFGGIDPFHGEYLLTLPKVLASNPNGPLPGGINGAPQNLFNIYDGMPKTMCYKIEQNKWMPAFSYTADFLLYSSNKLYGFKSGAAYVHNDPAFGYNTFYGTSYPSIVCFAGNKYPNSPKLTLAINIETEATPDVCYIYARYPNEQITDIQPGEWNDLEGVFYKSVMRDRLTPGFADPDLALNFGDKILAKAPLIQLNFIPTGPFNLKYVNLGYELSAGHKTIETP